MSSLDIKEQISSYYQEALGLDSQPSDWKRTSKKKVLLKMYEGFGTTEVIRKEVIRTFACAKLSASCTTYGEDESEILIEDGQWLFAAKDIRSDDAFMNGICVCFSSKLFWDKNKHIPDSHLEVHMKQIGLDLSFEELCENQFLAPSPWTLDSVRNHLLSLGLTEEPGMLL